MTAILLIVDASTGQYCVFEERRHELINFIQVERSSLLKSKIRYMALGIQTLCVVENFICRCFLACFIDLRYLDIVRYFLWYGRTHSPSYVRLLLLRLLPTCQ